MRPGLRALLDAMDHVPAYIVGHHTNLLAWNNAATALFVRTTDRHRSPHGRAGTRGRRPGPRGRARRRRLRCGIRARHNGIGHRTVRSARVRQRRRDRLGRIGLLRRRFRHPDRLCRVQGRAGADHPSTGDRRRPQGNSLQRRAARRDRHRHHERAWSTTAARCSPPSGRRIHSAGSGDPRRSRRPSHSCAPTQRASSPARS
nr:hypothetical protein [Nocardia albiluteola]